MCRVERAVSMLEAVVQIFHLHSDVIPSEMRSGVSSPGFARPRSAINKRMAELSGSKSPATTRPAPDLRTTSATPTSGA
jgi:hypothetical protein